MPQITFQLREYQKDIVETAKNKNTLVILGTGLGKTAISVALSLERLIKFPDSKALILAPTKPLVNQHYQTFLNDTTFPKEKIAVVTGQISSNKREQIYNQAKIIL